MIKFIYKKKQSISSATLTIEAGIVWQSVRLSSVPNTPLCHIALPSHMVLLRTRQPFDPYNRSSSSKNSAGVWYRTQVIFVLSKTSQWLSDNVERKAFPSPQGFWSILWIYHHSKFYRHCACMFLVASCAIERKTKKRWTRFTFCSSRANLHQVSHAWSMKTSLVQRTNGLSGLFLYKRETYLALFPGDKNS